MHPNPIRTTGRLALDRVEVLSLESSGIEQRNHLGLGEVIASFSR